MPVIQPRELSSRIRKGDLAHVYYIYGADVARVQQLTQALVHRCTEGDDNALTRMDGEKLDVQALLDVTRRFSMLSPCTCVRVHDLRVESLREEDFKALLAALPDLGDATVLIFDVTGFDPKNGKKSATGKTKKLIDTISKHGIVCEAVRPTPAELAKSVMSTAEKRGCVLPRESADLLVQLCLCDTLLVQNELDKLCAYADKGGTITTQMIEEVATPQPSSTTYRLADAVVAQKPKAAMAELDKLYAMRTDRVFIVHALASTFQDLYRASAALHAGKQQEDMQHDFAYRYDFIVRNAFRDGRRVPPERFRACIRVLRDLEITLNSTSADERTLLETAIMQMMAITGG